MKAQAEHVLDDKENLPIPLPPAHRRLSKLSHIPQQGSSPLFSLPVEIRLQIYSYVLAPPGVVHLFLRRRRVGHVRCTSTNVDIDQARTCMANQVDVLYEHKHYDFPPSSLTLALLMTCRAIYQEAVDILYTQNVFDVNHPQTFVYFARTVPSQRLASVASLHVTWAHDLHPYYIVDYCDSPQHWWGPLWEIAATQMPGLKHLRLRLDGVRYYIGWDTEEHLLQPLLPLRGLQSFELDRARLSESDNSKVSEIGDNIKDIICAPP